MPKSLKNLGNVFEGTAYGVLNEFLAEHRNDGGFALPSRYEVIFYPPAGDYGNEDQQFVLEQMIDYIKNDYREGKPLKNNNIIGY